MTRIRALRKEDIPAVVALRADRFRLSEHDDSSALASYMSEIFFGNPWYEEDLASLVAEDAEGRIIGFLGVVPRRMTLGGRPLRVATTTQLMVARTAPPVVGAQLLRTLFEGSQDLALADVATPAARRLWESLGGATATSSSLTWIRLLRPLRYLVARTAGGGVLGRVAGAFATPIDAVAGRLVVACGHPPAPRRAVRQPMSDAEVAVCLTRPIDQRAMRGEYDLDSVAWLMGMLRRKRSHGPLWQSRVADPRGELLGWYLYHANPRGNGLVAHIHARPRATGIVLDHLFHEAWLRGCAAVTGRFETRLADALAERHCLIYGPDAWVLVHARDRDLLAVVARDEAALTRLDGEWWMAF